MTRTRILAAAAVAATIAAPALANDQLAHSLGVEPGVYSLSELAQLKTATEENDDQRIDLITGGADEVLSTQSPVGDFGAGGSNQLARSLGVEPGVYSLSELAQLKTAMAENDHQRIDLITSGADEVLSTQSVGTSAGKAQLAASLGVNPEDYTTAQLARMHIDAHD